MASSFLRKCENLAVARYCMMFFGNSSKRDLEFYSKLYIEQSDYENLICFCFYFMDYHNTF